MSPRAWFEDRQSALRGTGGRRQEPGAAGRRYRDVRRVTLIGSFVDLALGVVKLIAGWLAHSQALMADGVHSLSDLATDLLVIFAAGHAHREADEDHPYGHGRIETAATVGLGAALVIIGAGIAWDAVHRLFNPERLLQPGAWALVVAVISVVAKEWVYRYTMRFARRLRSSLLRANAWHSRSDAFSSIVVVAAIGGAMAGLPYVDSIAAVVVAGMIAKIGYDFAWSSLRELVDTGLEPEAVERLRRSILAVDGVRALHSLRSRRMGSDALVDVHIQVDPWLSVSEGHYVSEAVRARLIAADDEVSDVVVHIDPEDDEEAQPTEHLPPRREVLPRLHARWSHIEAARKVKHVTLHYLNGHVHVDVLLPLECARDPQQVQDLTRAFGAAVSGEGDIARVRLFFH